MRHYHVERTIHADPDTVWGLLCDGPSMASWNSAVERIEGDIVDGARIRVFADVSPERAFPVRVALDPANRRMTWSGGMPLGLFRGRRTFDVRPVRDGACAFTMREEFSGPLLPLMWRVMPDLTESFNAFADSLRDRAQGDAARA